MLNVLLGAMGIIFFILLWMILDLKIGRWCDLNKRKRNHTPLCQSYLSLYTEGRKFYDALYQSLQSSQSSIHIMFFIWRTDEIGEKFIHLLCEKAKNGIEVWLLVDRLGSRGFLQHFKQPLLEAGVQFSYSHRCKLPFLFFTLNQRNHRKTVIIDGKIAYLGGFNIGKEYIGASQLGLWRDYHVKMVGEGAAEMEKRFFTDWKKSMHSFRKKPANQRMPAAIKGDTTHEIICTEGSYLLHTFLKLIQDAQKEIYIGTPYFIPGRKIFRALRDAQNRGVSITILIPTHEDHPLVKDAAKRYLRKLYAHGAKIYFYQAGFFHGKLMMIDQMRCLIGTANFDLRSMYINHEMSCLVHDPHFTQKTLYTFQKDLACSQLATYADLSSQRWTEKCKEWLATVISPFL